MQGGRGRGNSLFGFGDPFGAFGGIPDLFGGRDPFDDPFFTRPFGGMLGSPFMDFNPFGTSLLGPRASPFMDEQAARNHETRPSLPNNSRGMLGSPFMDFNPFGTSLLGPRASPFMDEQAARNHETRPSLPNNSRGPIIEELNSDDEKEQPDAANSSEPRQTQFGNDFSMTNATRSRPQAHSFTFQSSTVTYGDPDGAYRTSSMTKRTGSDGLRFEEYKEADTTTGQAAHRLSRGIHDKGHTVTRNLKSDGQVDTMQVLHNINEDEVDGFEEAWKGKARKHLPGWSGGATTNEGLEGRRGGLATLPSTEQSGEESRNHVGSHVGVRRRQDCGEQAQSSKIRKR